MIENWNNLLTHSTTGYFQENYVFENKEELRLRLKIEWIFLFAGHSLVMIILKYYYINNVLYHL